MAAICCNTDVGDEQQGEEKLKGRRTGVLYRTAAEPDTGGAALFDSVARHTALHTSTHV